MTLDKAFGDSVEPPIEIHCHNDLAMATANPIAEAKAALDAGVMPISIPALTDGERAGQCRLSQLYPGLKVCRRF